MSHPINDSIYERISEEYQIYQMIDAEIFKKIHLMEKKNESSN